MMRTLFAVMTASVLVFGAAHARSPFYDAPPASGAGGGGGGWVGTATSNLNMNGFTIRDTVGTLTCNDDVAITGTLDARSTIANSAGDVTIGDAAAVTGAIDLQGSVSNSTVANGGAVHVNDALTCVGAAVLQSTLDARGAVANSTGDVTINDAAAITGALDAQGALGNSTANNGGAVHIADAVTATGAAVLQSTADIQGALSNSTANNGGAVYVNDALTCVGAAVLQSTLNAQGAISNSGGNVSVDDALDVTGAVNAQTSVTSPFYAGATADPADSGVNRYANAELGPCWEASPASNDLCLTTDSTEAFVFRNGAAEILKVNTDGSIASGSDIQAGAAYQFRWATRTKTSAPADGQIAVGPNAFASGFRFQAGTNGVTIRDFATGASDGFIAASAATFSGLTTMTGGAKLPVQTAAVPAAPATCDATAKGRLEVVDDNNDGAATVLCYCGMTDDSTYDWLKVSDNTACPFY